MHQNHEIHHEIHQICETSSRPRSSFRGRLVPSPQKTPHRSSTDPHCHMSHDCKLKLWIFNGSKGSLKTWKSKICLDTLSCKVWDWFHMHRMCIAASLHISTINYIWMFHFYSSYEIIWPIVVFDYLKYNLMERLSIHRLQCSPCFSTFPLGQKKTFWCRSLESKLRRLFDGSSEMEIQKIHRFLAK